jgi:hypothetical protein
VSANLSGKILATREFELTVIAQPGEQYIILASTNLSSWIPIATQTASGAGVIKFTDTASATLKARYYRTQHVIP